MIEINEWIASLRTLKLPKYKELPTIPLYLDQVLEYVNVTLQPIFGEDSVFITSAMINNYVKQKLMPAPVKKRYDRDHLAYIITITVLKQVVSIPNVVSGILTVREHYGKEDAFNIFAHALENGFKTVIAQTYGEINVKELEFNDILIPIKAASVAFAAKLIAERALADTIEKREISYE